MEIKVLFKTSKGIHPKFDSLSIGKYTIEPIPGEVSRSPKPTKPFLLRFNDKILRHGESTRPQDEARFALSCLALMLSTRLEIEEVMTGSLPFTSANDRGRVYDEYENVLEELPDLNLLFRRIRFLEKEYARQFFRACDVYRIAINLIGQNNTLSFFLFTIAIECLSHKIKTKDSATNKFVDFIRTYHPDCTTPDSEVDIEGLLKEIYSRHRSGFTHGGKEIPRASFIADSLNRPYVLNIIDGKEVRTPSLKWFESIVQSTLIGYLNSIDIDNGEGTDHLKEISIEEDKITFKGKGRRKIEPLTPVYMSDLELD